MLCARLWLAIQLMLRTMPKYFVGYWPVDAMRFWHAHDTALRFSPFLFPVMSKFYQRRKITVFGGIFHWNWRTEWSYNEAHISV